MSKREQRQLVALAGSIRKAKEKKDWATVRINTDLRNQVLQQILIKERRNG